MTGIDQVVMTDVTDEEQQQEEIAQLRAQVAALTKTIENLQKVRNEGTTSSSRAEASVTEVSNVVPVGASPRENQQLTFQMSAPVQIPITKVPQQTGQANLPFIFQAHNSTQQSPASQNTPFTSVPQQLHQYPPYSQEQTLDFFNFGNSGANEAVYTTAGPHISAQRVTIPSPTCPLDAPFAQGSQEDIRRKEESEKFSALEERLRAIEGSRAYGPLNPEELCLVPGVIVPKKFKVPEFEKYAGASNPKSHLISYCREMTEVAHNDKLLIHYFHKSLTGAALRWYM